MTEQSRFVPMERYVTAGFRSRVLARFPRLRVEDADGLFGRRLLQEILFGTFLDAETGLPVLPATTVATLAGQNRNAGNFRHSEKLRLFQEMAFPLNPGSHHWRTGRATTIDPAIPTEVIRLLGEELRAHRDGSPGELVWFVSGEPVSRRAERAWRAAVRDSRLALADETRADHPARELMETLNQQPERTIRSLLECNRTAVEAAVMGLPRDTEPQARYARMCESLLRDLRSFPRPIYHGVERSARLFAGTPSLHQFPREIRKLALTGATSLDLGAAQLAIVAKLWGIRSLERCFEDSLLPTGRSFWTEMLQHLGVGDDLKPTLKRASYGITYGMGERRYTRLLREGREKPREVARLFGLGRARTLAFLNHPLMADLLDARDRQYDLVVEAGGAFDSFGEWVPLDKHPGAVLARVAQSYELRLMLPVLSILQEERVRPVSWLHDGLTVVFGDRTRKKAQVRRMKEAVNQEARRMNIRTRLEVEEYTGNQ